MTKGLICSIYQDKDGVNCSNNGISSKYKDVLVIMAEGEGQVFDEDPKRPTVKIVRRIIQGKEYIHAEPVNPIKSENIGYMFGGCFIFSSDSRFSRFISQYPVALHDRQESQEEYDILSR